MLLIGFTGAWLWWRGRLFDTPWYLQYVQYAWPLGFIAILAGWYTTEIGRQPWIVYGVMRTKDAVSSHSAELLAVTLGIFIVVYVFVFGVGIRYLLALIAKGPEAHEPDPVQSADASPNRPARPLSAAPDDVGLH
jgi:cytochrome d ubiquinol oxidase subunit I